MTIGGVIAFVRLLRARGRRIPYESAFEFAATPLYSPIPRSSRLMRLWRNQSEGGLIFGAPGEDDFWYARLVWRIPGQDTGRDFWGTYCPPCRDELPLLEGLQRAYGEKIHVVAVNFWESNYTVKTFERNNPDLNITVLTDSRHRVARRFSVKAIPATFLFDTNGSLRWKKIGYTEVSLDDLISEINKLLEPQAGQSESNSSIPKSRDLPLPAEYRDVTRPFDQTINSRRLYTNSYRAAPPTALM